MQRRNLLRLALAGGAALVLNGCGFQLRGLADSAPLPAAVALTGDDGALAERLAERLRLAGTRVSATAPRVLHLEPPVQRERRLSVLDAGSQEVELQLSVAFSLQRRADGAFLLPRQTLELSQRITLNSDNLLAQEQLRQEAGEALRQAAASQLLERLRGLDRR